MSYRVEIPDNSYWQKQIKCQEACPVGTDARGYVRAVANGDFENAYLIARGPNPLASICGRICAAPCEVDCRRGDIDKPISIRALKRFAFEKYSLQNKNEKALDILEDIRRYISNRENRGKDELTACDFAKIKKHTLPQHRYICCLLLSQLSEPPGSWACCSGSELSAIAISVLYPG